MATSDYVKHYDKTWTDLMKKQDRFPLQEYADRSVLTTWTMSYEQVKGQSEAAAGLLRLWGFLDCGDLWYELVASASRLDLSMETLGWLQLLIKSKFEFSDAVQILAHYSLIDAKAETSGHSMHSVLHEWCYRLVECNENRMLCWVAASIVAYMQSKISNSEYWNPCQRLLPHGSRVYRALDDDCFKQSHGENDWAIPPWVFFELGRLFAPLDKLDEAEKMYQRALKGYEKAHGAEHTSTLDTINNLGVLYAVQGKLDEAEKLYQRALKEKEKTLGEEHTSTLNTIKNLGLLYVDQDKLDEAEKLYQRALKGYEKTLDAEHTSTFRTMINLRLLYADQGKLNEAEKICQQELKEYEKTFGAEHILTLDTINDLGNLYRKQGKLDEAEKMYQRALKGYQISLRPNHARCQRLIQAIAALDRPQGMKNLPLCSVRSVHD